MQQPRQPFDQLIAIKTLKARGITQPLALGPEVAIRFQQFPVLGQKAEEISEAARLIPAALSRRLNRGVERRVSRLSEMQFVVPKRQQPLGRMARDHQPQGMGIAKPMLLLLLAEIRQAWQPMNFSAVNRKRWPGFTKCCGALRLTAIGQHRHSL